MRKNMLKYRDIAEKNTMSKNSKGITLIALVISVIVLLILAGVSISAITGNESAMEKAKEARTANEAGAELDSIKLAVVSAMSKNVTTYGMVEPQYLKAELAGLVTSETLAAITNESTSPWEVIGAKAGRKYKIFSSGTVQEVAGAYIDGDSTVLFRDTDTTNTKSLLVVAESGTISGITLGTVSNKAINVTTNGANITVKLLTQSESGVSSETYNTAIGELVSTSGVPLTATATNNGKNFPINFTVKIQDTVLKSINVKTESLELTTTGTTNTGIIEIEGRGEHNGIVPLTGEENVLVSLANSSDVTYVKLSSNGTSWGTSAPITTTTPNSVTVRGDEETESTINVTVSFGDNGIVTYSNGGSSVPVTVEAPAIPTRGDFVNYSAGPWTTDEINAIDTAGMYVENGAKPIKDTAEHGYKFGGFKAGTLTDAEKTAGIVNSKDATISSVTNSGWRILETTEEDGITYITKIIHAGAPEVFYHVNDSITGLSKFNARNWNVYKDSTFASTTDNVYLIDKDTIEQDEYASVRTTGGSYWLPSRYYDSYGLYYVNGQGGVNGYRNYVLGIRPVVTLKEGVTVQETSGTHNTPTSPWTLVAPSSGQ